MPGYRKLRVSAIVCSHDPDKSGMDRVMEALRRQTMPREFWELMVVDNASPSRLSEDFEIDWHPCGRHLTEDRLGLTPARLCGMAASRGEILVFVDDDNILDPDYLEVAHWIGMRWPMLGSWSGRIDPQFDSPPPEWTRPYWDMLAVRTPERDHWSSVIGFHEATPFGAGLCVRRRVAAYYANKLKQDDRHLALDRRGSALLGCGDVDIAFAGCEMGLGMGVFTDLHLTHLIPDWRLTERYLARLAEASEYASMRLKHMYNIPISYLYHSNIVYRIRWAGAARMKPRDRRIYRARLRGRAKAAKDIGAGAPFRDFGEADS